MGRLDIAVNNGTFYSNDWDTALSSELTSVYNCCMAGAVEMKKQGKGKIVNIASICGTTVIVAPSYSVAKAGVIMLTRCLARNRSVCLLLHP